MSLSDSEDCNLKNLWLLVSWVGSTPKESLDIINCKDVVFDNLFTPKCLKVSSLVMVKCGKMKSPALVKRISENTDILMKELRELQNRTDKENVDPGVTPKTKRAKLDKKGIKSEKTEACTQTEDLLNEALIQALTEENQKLKAELYEAHKIINGMCKDLKVMVQTTQKKMQDPTNTSLDDNDDSYSVNSDDKDSNHGISCPVEEFPLKVLIGSGKTEVPRQVYAQINWMSYAAATRKLLMAVFPRQVLATHSLTGKPSPAFQYNVNMPSKDRLDPKKVADIVQLVTWKCRVSEALVRSAITTKCADENKMYKKRLEKIKKDES